MTMNPEIKTKWVEALRSGDFTQGTGVLHKVEGGADKFCCLGVLCKLAEDAGAIEPAEFNPRNEWYAYLRVDTERGALSESALLPARVVEWAGLDDIRGFDVPAEHIPERFHSPELVFEGKTSLPALNDHGMTFEEAADLIEALA